MPAAARAYKPTASASTLHGRCRDSSLAVAQSTTLRPTRRSAAMRLSSVVRPSPAVALTNSVVGAPGGRGNCVSSPTRLRREASSHAPIPGTCLSIIGWALTLLALQRLPLFVVQAVGASSIGIVAHRIRPASSRHVPRPPVRRPVCQRGAPPGATKPPRPSQQRVDERTVQDRILSLDTTKHGHRTATTSVDGRTRGGESRRRRSKEPTRTRPWPRRIITARTREWRRHHGERSGGATGCTDASSARRRR